MATTLNCTFQMIAVFFVIDHFIQITSVKNQTDNKKRNKDKASFILDGWNLALLRQENSINSFHLQPSKLNPI